MQANALLALLLLAACAALIAMSLWTEVDLVLADRAFDRRLGQFPLRHAWIAATFNHEILKGVFIALGLVIMLAVFWDLCAPRAWSGLRRFQLRVIALSAILVPATSSLLKHASSSHCPWDLQRYGGSAPYIRLFELMPSEVGAGHCMPAGHASGAFWMISLSVLFMPQRLRCAAFLLAFLLAFGIGVGWVQQLRGAHFLSHTLWSAWIALAIFFLITTALDRWPRRSIASDAG